MRLCYLQFITTILIPAVACAEDSFVFSRKYVQPEPVQQQEQQQQQYQEPYQQQQVQPTPYAAQPTGAMTQPAPAAMGYGNQQGNAVQQGYAGQQGYANTDQQRAYVNTGGNVHEIPATPPGWDSLTTGTSNGGGVLGSANGMNGYGNNQVDMYGNNAFTDGSAAQSLLNTMGAGNSNSAYGNVSVNAEGDMSPKERAMYASFLGSLLQFVQSQPDTVTSSSPGYKGGGWQPVTPAYNNAVPMQGAQPARPRVQQQGGTMGVSAPAAPCPNGVRGVVGAGC